MVLLIQRPPYFEIRGADIPTMRKLEECTSYKVAGHRFAPAFKARRWDGREHLIKFKRGRYIAPIGLLSDIRAKLRELGLKHKVMVSKKAAPPPRIDVSWNEKIELRDYQLAAIDAFVSGPDKGRGILKMPIRSGKTKTAAGVIYRLQVRTLFLVPSQLLLHQTIASLEEALPDADIGAIGDGEWREGKDITVATIQSVSAARGGMPRQCRGNAIRNESGIKTGEYKAEKCACSKKKCDGGRKYLVPPSPRWPAIRDGYGLLAFDEAHHLVGETWHDTFMEITAPYRLALTATVYFDLEKEIERGVIWIKACCGNIKYEVKTSELIERGFLMRQNVKLYKVTSPDLRDQEKWRAELRDLCIYENPRRNLTIAVLARMYVERGLSVLIVTDRHNQIFRLSEALDKLSLEHVVVTGREVGDDRAARIKLFRTGRVNVLLGTVFGEGVDIPEVEVLINAEGGSDVKRTIQRMRNMTPSKGKTRAILIDFFDQTNKHFARHSRARIKTYESEPAFRIRRMWLPKKKDKRA